MTITLTNFITLYAQVFNIFDLRLTGKSCLFSFIRYAILYLKSKSAYSYLTLTSELRAVHVHDHMGQGQGNLYYV